MNTPQPLGRPINTADAPPLTPPAEALLIALQVLARRSLLLPSRRRLAAALSRVLRRPALKASGLSAPLRRLEMRGYIRMWRESDGARGLQVIEICACGRVLRESSPQ
jgi:hypothetical protein